MAMVPRVSTDDELCVAFGRTFLCGEGAHGHASARLMEQLLRPGSYLPDLSPQATVQQAVRIVQQRPAASHYAPQHNLPGHDPHAFWHAPHQTSPYTAEAQWAKTQWANALWAQAQQPASTHPHAASHGPATAPKPSRTAPRNRSQKSAMHPNKPVSMRNAVSTHSKPKSVNVSDRIASAAGDLPGSAAYIKATTDSRVTRPAVQSARSRAAGRQSATRIKISAVDLFASEGLATARRPLAAGAARGRPNLDEKVHHAQHPQQAAAEQCVGACTTASSLTTYTEKGSSDEVLLTAEAGQAAQPALAACMAACGPEQASSRCPSVRAGQTAKHSTEPVCATAPDDEQPIASAETAATRGASVRLVDGPHAGERGTVTGVDDDGDVYVSLANGARCVLGRRQFDILLQAIPTETSAAQSVLTDAELVCDDAEPNGARLLSASSVVVRHSADVVELLSQVLEESSSAPSSATATPTASHVLSALPHCNGAWAAEGYGAPHLNDAPQSTTRWKEGEDAMMSALRLTPPGAAVDKALSLLENFPFGSD